MINVDKAMEMLRELNAPARLCAHVLLVKEAAEVLIAEFQDMNVRIDESFILTGVIIHDIGKINHQNELHASGNEHELAGEQLLLARGVDPAIARVCRSHAQFDQMDCTLNELVIALADKLWKGKRAVTLEERVIDTVSELLSADRWDVFMQLDNCFESIAADGELRIQKQALS